jgi:hypothetical protein
VPPRAWSVVSARFEVDLERICPELSFAKIISERIDDVARPNRDADNDARSLDGSMSFGNVRSRD